MNGVLSLIKKCGFNYDGTALDYLCACVSSADARHDEASPRELKLMKKECELTKKIREGLTSEQAKLIEDLDNISGEYCSLNYGRGFSEGLKLGLRLGAEVFTDEDSKDYRDIEEDD
jgi:hypothetical protein